MKIEEYVWSFSIFLLIFFVHYCLGRLHTGKVEPKSEVHVYRTYDTELFKAIKIKQGSFDQIRLNVISHDLRI
jgi:hypothetical protein